MVEIWQLEQYGKCPDCGTFDWEWEEDPKAWVADLHWCLGCKSREELQADTAVRALHPEGYKIRLFKQEREED